LKFRLFSSNEVGVCDHQHDPLLQVIANFRNRVPCSWEGAKFADFSKLTAMFSFLFSLGFRKNVQTVPLPEMLETVCCSGGGQPSRSLTSSSELSSAF